MTQRGRIFVDPKSERDFSGFWDYFRFDGNPLGTFGPGRSNGIGGNLGEGLFVATLNAE